MRERDSLTEPTRRTVLGAAGGLLAGVAVTGLGASHPTVPLRSRMFEGNEPSEFTDNVALESYHSLGGVGP
jgi:hypothetical protein